MTMSRILKVMFAVLFVTVLGVSVSNVAAQSGSHTSSQFQGPKANKGTVTHSIKDGKSVLTLSDEFVVPDTPDPHWQVVIWCAFAEVNLGEAKFSSPVM